MLIFGLRDYLTLLATLVYVCDRCGQQAAHRLVKRVRKFTLFFLPVFPVSTRYDDTCVACGRQLAVDADQAEEAARQAVRPY